MQLVETKGRRQAQRAALFHSTVDLFRTPEMGRGWSQAAGGGQKEVKDVTMGLPRRILELTAAPSLNCPSIFRDREPITANPTKAPICIY